MAGFTQPASSAENDSAEEAFGLAGGLEVHQDTAPLNELETMAQLAKTIEGEIIPRLLLAHKTKGLAGAQVAPPVVAVQGFSQDEIEAFAKLTYAFATVPSFSFLDDVRAKGVSLESIILDLLAPTARYLGDMWKADRCDFTQVTVGLSRLRQMLRNISAEFEDETSSWKHGRRALLLPTPGEQHTFGLFIVEAFFRREGWDVWAAPAASVQEVEELAASQWFAVAGFSLHCEKSLDNLSPAIRAVRSNSLNREIGILVGGQAFRDNPNLVAEVGADACAEDGRMAVVEARNVLARVTARN